MRPVGVELLDVEVLLDSPSVLCTSAVKTSQPSTCGD